MKMTKKPTKKIFGGLVAVLLSIGSINAAQAQQYQASADGVVPGVAGTIDFSLSGTTLEVTSGTLSYQLGGYLFLSGLDDFDSAGNEFSVVPAALNLGMPTTEDGPYGSVSVYPVSGYADDLTAQQITDLNNGFFAVGVTYNPVGSFGFPTTSDVFIDKVSTPVSTPEPSTWSLLGAALGLLAFCYRRRLSV